MTKDALEKMTVKQLEAFLNECVADITYTSIDRSDIRGRMIEKIKKEFGPEFNIYCSHTRNEEFKIQTKKFSINVEVVAKSNSELINTVQNNILN